MKIKHWLLYPIKLILKNKVLRYQALLRNLIYKKNHIRIKPRRKGMDDINAGFMLYDASLEIKYENFIKKWKI